MQMSKRVKGSISVLLTMILLPMMTYATMIIDASRLQLVRNNIAGAGDLALNAIMSEYNIMLEEMYGLFANTTSEEELQDVLKAYFQQTIEGRFLPQLRNDHAMVQDTVNKMLDLAMNKNGYTREGITDFLALQLQDFSASAVTGSALANPAAMRRQITEYMKYRGPVSIGSTLLGKLDFLKDSGQQVDACDAKVTYAESLSGLHDPCMEAYRSITGEYNNGALLMNELIGQGLVGKKFDESHSTNGNRLALDKKQKDPESTGKVYTDAKLEYQYATAFALMNARSPFARNNPNINQSIHIDGVDYQVCNGKSDSHEHHNYDSYLEEEQDAYKLINGENVQESYQPTDDIQENINRLNALIKKAGTDCGYNNDHARLVMKSGNLNVNIGYLDTNSQQRSAGKFDLYRKNTFSVDSGVNKETRDNVTYHYPNYKRMLLSGKENSDNYYYNIKSFIDMNKSDTDNDKIKNNELKKEDVAYQFETQYENSMKVLEAQQELVGPLKNGIQYVAKHQAIFSEIQSAYQAIWNKLKDQLLEQYNDKCDARRKEKEEELQKAREQWVYSSINTISMDPNGKGWKAFVEYENEGEEDEKVFWKEGYIPQWANDGDYGWEEGAAYEEFSRYLDDIKALVYAAEYDVPEICNRAGEVVSLAELERKKEALETEKNTLTWDEKEEIKKLERQIEAFIEERIYDVMVASGDLPENCQKKAAYLTPDEEKTFWKEVLDNCHIAVDENNQMKYYDEKHESPIYDGMNQINNLEYAQVAMEEIQSFFNGGQSGYSSYKDLINEYITRLKNHNQDYFGRFEDIHIKLGSSAYMGVALTLHEMKKGLETAENELNEIYTLIVENIEPQQTKWKQSIDGIESDSTRASMTSDYNSMISQINKDEVAALRDLVHKLKEQIQIWIDTIDSCSYLGEKLVTIGSDAESKGKKLCHADNKIFLDNVEASMKEHFNCDIIVADDDTDIVVQTSCTAIRDKMKAEDPFVLIPKYNDSQNPDKDNDTEKINTLLKDHGYIKDNGELTKEIKEIAAEWINNKTSDDKAALNDENKFNISEKFNEFTRYTILDGLKDLVDDNQISAPTGADKEKADIEDINLKYQLKGAKGMGELIDPDEVFMITLYSEAKAEETAANADTDVEAAGKSSSDSIQAIANAKSEGADADPEEKAADKELNKEDFGTIMTNIQEYCEAAEDEYTEMNLDGKVEIKTGEIKTGKEASKSKAGGGLKEAKKILNEFTDIGTTIVENVYLEEYFTEMFTCRTDNQRLNSLTKKEDANTLPVILLNGYGNEASGASKQLNEYTEWYGKEIEYLLWGNDTLNSNLAATDATIFAIRFALNAIYAFTAPEIIQYVNSVATALAGWTVIGVPIIAACLTIALAIAESGYDIYLLHDGQDVPIYKDRTTFACSPVNALKNILETAATEIAEGVIENAAQSIEDKLDDAVDGLATKFGDLANKKISDCAGDMEDFVNKFGNDQVEAIRSAIRKQFFAPIQNQLIQIGSLMDINEKYEKLEVDSLLDGLIDQTLQEIKTNVSNTIASDSVVYQVCDEIFTNYFNDFKAEIVGVINNYFANGANNLTDILQAPVNEAANQVESLEAKFNAVVDKYVTKIDEQKHFITDKIGAVKDSINQAVKAKTDEAATSIKSFMHEQITVGTQKLTGMVGTVVDEAKAQTATSLKKEDVKGPDTGLASRVTLNYKEYCKILMLIIVNVSSETVLQRAGVLITANMRHPEHEQTVDFNLTSANTLFSVNANVNMMTLFPWPVKDVIDEANPDSGIQLDLTHLQSKMMTLSYCGVNGY